MARASSDRLKQHTFQMEKHVDTFEQAQAFVRELIEEAFPTECTEPRHTGPEEEFVVVDARGFAADITPLFPALVQEGWQSKHDAVTGALVGVHQNGVEIGMDVGVGTLEIGFPHVGNLLDHIGVRANVLGFVDERLGGLGLLRLRDYAIQPRTPPNERLWAPKGRGDAFRRIFPPAVHMNTLTASSQVHIDLARHEVIPALETLLALAPVLIAINANSPVWAGAPDPDKMLAARQHAWYGFTVNHGYWDNVRCGAPAFVGEQRAERAPASLEELAQSLCAAPFIVRVKGQTVEHPGVPFHVWYAREGHNLSQDERRMAYLNHEGTVWWQARARVLFGTLEVRPSCQNKDAVATDALVLGLVENLEASLAFVRATGSHEKWRALETAALTQGLHSTPLCEAASHVLALGEEGLRHRGFGEEVLLDPLKARVREAASPAHTKLDTFTRDGIEAFLAHLMNG